VLRRILLTLMLLCAVASVAEAQSTTVSGTISDSSGQIWANGSYNIAFYANGLSQPFVWNGGTLSPGTIFKGSLDNTGSFSGVPVPSSNAISPIGTSWRFTVCPAATATQCFTQTIVVTGTTLSVSALIVPPPVIVNAQAQQTLAAYTDAEITGARLGTTYYNLTDQTIHVCTAPLCSWISITAGGNLLPLNNTWTGTNTWTALSTFDAAATFNAAMNATDGGELSGVFSGNPTLTGNPTISGNLTATAGQNTVNAYNISNFIYVDGNKYPTLSSALATDTSSGLWVYDCYPAEPAWTADPFAAAGTNPYHVTFCPGIWMTSVPIRNARGNGQVVEGAGFNGTKIEVTNSFPSGNYVISNGNAPGYEASYVHDIQAICTTAITNCGGFNFDGDQENDGGYNLAAYGTGSLSAFRISTDTGPTQNMQKLRGLQGVQLTGTAPVMEVTSTVGSRIEVEDLTLTGNSGTAGVEVDESSDIRIEGIHCEAVASCILKTNAGAISVTHVLGLTNVVNLFTSQNTSASYSLNLLIPNGATGYSLNDTGSSVTCSGEVDHIVKNPNNPPAWLGTCGAQQIAMGDAFGIRNSSQTSGFDLNGVASGAQPNAGYPWARVGGSGSSDWYFNPGAASGFLRLSADQGHVSQSEIAQNAGGQYAGSCTMSAATTCTGSVSTTFTNPPLCLVSGQTAASCAFSSGTVTVTAASSNSNQFTFLVIGAPF
jgi:hypothetical protein